jgi:hypothetical protein
MYNKAKNRRIEVHSTNMNQPPSVRGLEVSVLVRFGNLYNMINAQKTLNAGWVPWSKNSGKVHLKLFDGCK